MKVHIQNLGALREAKFELGDITIICGTNNTGKTYATYALFGFFSFWKAVVTVPVSDETINLLLQDGVAEIDLEEYFENAQQFITDGCAAYTGLLSKVFASSEKYFSESKFDILLEDGDIQPLDNYEKMFGTAQNDVLKIIKAEKENKLHISLLFDKETKPKVSPNVGIGETLKEKISEAIEAIVFNRLFPNPFIASAERTGAAIFRKELNLSRNRLLEHLSDLGGSGRDEINLFEVISKVYSDYALPVKENVNFTRQLEGLSNKDSFIQKNHPDILEDFSNIIGGKYEVTRNDELHYIPNNKKIRLTMDESSSAVRSLLDVGFYLRHVANLGDILIIDEPELNLHPINQRRMAKLFARLANKGVKVFITTHSDYILKELSTLIMLNQPNKSRLIELAQRENYRSDELLHYNQLRVYLAGEATIKLDTTTRKVKCNTLIPNKVTSEFGIEAVGFDDTIDDMNRIQDEILWGD